MTLLGVDELADLLAVSADDVLALHDELRLPCPMNPLAASEDLQWSADEIDEWQLAGRPALGAWLVRGVDFGFLPPDPVLA